MILEIDSSSQILNIFLSTIFFEVTGLKNFDQLHSFIYFSLIMNKPNF